MGSEKVIIFSDLFFFSIISLQVSNNIHLFAPRFEHFVSKI